ncbi:MAG: 6-phosphogluconolactonase, partial [Pseudomonadota bacterium]
GGPRHLALDPQEKYAYVLSELESLITTFNYDSTTGKLSGARTINSYKTEAEAGSSAHIVVHPNGKWLYASNRKENSLGLFAIDAQGQPQVQADDFVTDMIATPRDFSVDPTGTLLILANQNGAQNVLVYRIDQNNGKLTRSQVFPLGGSPTFVQALLLP